jgi:hypothetical protein
LDVRFDSNGVAELDEPLRSLIHDLSDRKLVAAALEALARHGDAAIANACDSDWVAWEAGLHAAGVYLEQILPEWCDQKYREKCPSD